MGPDKSVQIGPNERLLFTTVVEGNVLMLILDNLVASKYLRTYLYSKGTKLPFRQQNHRPLFTIFSKDIVLLQPHLNNLILG